MLARTSATLDVCTSHRTLIVVLGMHRSGTSVATRMMETMGASLGDNLWPAGPDNPKGFFEDSDIIRLNVELMEAAGVDWQALPSPNLGRLSQQQLALFEQRALDLLQTKCASGMFALKDPRIGRLLPFWRRVFDRFGAHMLYVVPFRHPLSVADSLAKRNKISRGKSHMLWLAHVVPALRFVQTRPHVLLNYDRLMEAPGGQVRKLAQTFALSLAPERVRIFEQEFLEEALRHSTFGIDDLDRDEAAPAPLKALFAAMVAEADESSETRHANCAFALAQAEGFLRDVESMLGYGWELELDIRKLYGLLDTEHKQAVALEQSVTTFCARETLMRAELAQANARCEAIMEENTRQAATLNGILKESRAATHEVEMRLARCGSELAAREAEIAGQEARNAHLMQLVAARETDIANLVASTSWRITAPMRFARRCLRR